jgi:broad specificity phosphatase PhoE
VLILMRHGPPGIEPGLPASAWHLSAEGNAAVRRFCPQLRGWGIQRVVTSEEAKARETGAIVATELGVECESAPDLHEHRRRTVPFSSRREEFEHAVADAIRNPTELRLGEETAGAAEQRFAAAVDGCCQRGSEGTLCVVAHGTVIALFAARVAGVDALELWRGLELPSALVLDRRAGRLVATLLPERATP